jgi:cytochrome c oxidase cbb3-type subunit 3
MAVDHEEVRDSYTGYLTTGHEWNGITELNTPVPRAVYFFLTLAFLFSVGYWVLMPAWPLGDTYTKGLLGIDQRKVVAASLTAAATDRSAWSRKIAGEDYAAIQADPALMAVVRETGHTLFGNNCAACHGVDAKGGPGFPNLTTSSWLWGGKPEDIFNTIKVGINSAHKDSRSSQMPAFGRDQMLPRGDVLKAASYVYSLSHPGTKDLDPKNVEAGKAIFAANCVACHGENAKGNAELGAPDLTDKSWIYGGDLETIDATIWGGRQGHMPTWEGRLSDLDRKILTLYLLDKRGATP